MRESLKIIRIFIGSPGGLDSERQAAHRVVNEVNLSCADHWGCEFKLLGWESVVPGFQRPQEKINEDLDRCRYFIGVLWNKWGTKTSVDPDGYTSGFEEEFRRAKKRVSEGHMKDILMLFKHVDVPPGFNPGDELKRVFEFREELINGKELLFRDFKDLTGFEECVRSKLMEIGWSEAIAVDDGPAVEDAPEKQTIIDLTAASKQQTNKGLVEDQARGFLIELADRPSDWEATANYEVARFRLIANSLARAGNDEATLGPHDANLIFRHLRNSQLSRREISELAECGIASLEHKNAPLWHWLSLLEKSSNQFDNLVFWSITTKRRKNAIRVLHYLGRPLPEMPNVFSKREILKLWLVDETDASTVSVALSFIASNADLNDIELLEQVLADASTDRQDQIRGAIAGVISRASAQRALIYLIDHSVEAVPRALVDRIFGNGSLLQTDTLVGALSAKNDEVRVAATRLLHTRRELSSAITQTLLTDSNYEIRFIAALTLLEAGTPVDEKSISNILTEVKKGVGFGLFGQPSKDAKWFDRYYQHEISGHSVDYIRARVASSQPFSSKELAALYRKLGRSARDEILVNLRDEYSDFLNSAVESMVLSIGAEVKQIADVWRLEASIRSDLCSVALNALCAFGKHIDIDVVRSTLDRRKITASVEIIQFLGKFGDWTDVKRIIGLRDSYTSASSLLGLTLDSLAQDRARALINVSQSRIADLLELELELPLDIRNAIARALPRNTIVQFDDETLLRELNRDVDEYRWIFAIRCLQSLGRDRIGRLFQNYINSDEYRFYNVVHILDLGSAFSSRRAREIAARMLA